MVEAHIEAAAVEAAGGQLGGGLPRNVQHLGEVAQHFLLNEPRPVQVGIDVERRGPRLQLAQALHYRGQPRQKSLAHCNGAADGATHLHVQRLGFFFAQQALA